MLEENGDVMTKVIPNRQEFTLFPHIATNITAGSEIHTDEHRGYYTLRNEKRYTHKRVNHSKEEYVGPSGETTNSIEGFFMHLKRTIKGTHIWVSAKHLHSYTGEAEFICNRRKNPNSMMIDLLTVFPKV